MPVATAVSVCMSDCKRGLPCVTVFGLLGVACMHMRVVILGEGPT